MVEVLCYVIKKKRSLTEDHEGAVMLGRFIHALTETRAHSLRCKQLVDHCLIQLFPDIEYPELLLEMLGDERVNMLQNIRAASGAIETEINITEPLSPPPPVEPCKSEKVNPEDFDAESIPRHQEQVALYEETTPPLNIGKIAGDAIRAQGADIGSQLANKDNNGSIFNNPTNLSQHQNNPTFLPTQHESLSTGVSQPSWWSQ